MTPESMRASEQAMESDVQVKSKLQATIEKDQEILQIMDDLIGAKNELTQTTEPAAIQRLKTKIKTLELLQQEREQVIRDTFFKVKQVPTQEEDVDPYKHEGTQRIGPNLSKYRQ